MPFMLQKCAKLKFCFVLKVVFVKKVLKILLKFEYQQNMLKVQSTILLTSDLVSVWSTLSGCCLTLLVFISCIPINNI